jgi:hypothetical protein
MSCALAVQPAARPTRTQREEALFSPLRAAVSAALARPGAPTQSVLARAAGIAPENLNAWLAGRRTIPVRAIEAMLAQLVLVVVPRTKIDGAGNSGRR